MSAPRVPQPVPSEKTGSTRAMFTSRWVIVWGALVYVVALGSRYLVAWAFTNLRGANIDFQLTTSQEYDPLGMLFGAVIGTAIAIIGYLTVVRRVEGRSGAGLTGHGKTREAVVGLVIGTVLVIAVIALIAALGGYQIRGLANAPDVLTPLAVGLGAAAIEETFFRGILMRILDEWLGTWAALVLTAVLFGFMHLFNQGVGLWGALAISVEAGLLFGAAFLATRRLWLAMGIHAAWNTVQTLASYPQAAAHSQMGLWDVKVAGPDWLTGASAGLEGSVSSIILSLIAAAILLVIAIRRGNVRAAPAPRA